MRIGVDARPLQAETRHRGIGKSLEFFLYALAKHAKDNTLVFYVDGKLPVPEPLQVFPKAEIIHYTSLAWTRKKYIRSIIAPWRALRVKTGDVDVLLQYDAALGVPRNVPTVVIFHDLIPFLFHQQERAAAVTPSPVRTLKNQLAGLAYWHQYLRSLDKYRHARTIVAISETSRRDYINRFPFAAQQRIVVIPHGVDRSFFAKPPRLTADLARRITKPYFIYVGGIDYRKNVAGLLRDFFELRRTHDAQLLLVGKEFALQDQLDDMGWSTLMRQYGEYQEDVIRPGFVSHNDLISLLAGSEALVFPSLYEGFGMPALEAMATGCPVIAYDNSATGEVVKGYGTMLSDGASFTQTMQDVIDSPAAYKTLATKARTQALKFTWSRTVESILEELQATSASR